MRVASVCLLAASLVGCVRLGFDGSGPSAEDTRSPADTSIETGPTDAPTADGKLPGGDSLKTTDLAQSKADVLPVCSPPCKGSNICCDKGSGPRCVDSDRTDNCKCDQKTGVPCTPWQTLCCDKGNGPRCYDTDLTEDCICDPTTGKPCKAGWTACCDKGSGPRCVDDDMTQGCACDPTTGKPCGFDLSCCPSSGGKYACGHCAK